MANKTSQHILNTSANLLGFCLFIITSLHISSKTENNLLDEMTSLVAIFLVISSIFSFMSIKTENPINEAKLEKIAEYFFLIALICILIIILFIGAMYIN